MKEYRDFYFRKAKTENYPARSVYKLKEMDSKFNLLRRGMKVLDLGAAPGSWTLGAAEKIGPTGLVLACDLKSGHAEFPPHVRFYCEDVFEPSPDFRNDLACNGPFGLVMSDMAPATTGNKCTDQARSLELALAALELARANLGEGGNFVAKIFMGPDIQELFAAMRAIFAKVKTFKPKSSRAESFETFCVGLGFQPLA